MYLFIDEWEEEVNDRGRDSESKATDELHSIPLSEKCQVPETYK